jgi:hypothetical protein
MTQRLGFGKVFRWLDRGRPCEALLGLLKMRENTHSYNMSLFRQRLDGPGKA